MLSEEQLHQLFYKKESGIHGDGLFARLKIKQGEYMGEYDGPVVSDNGNFIIDADFGEISNPGELNMNFLKIAGVVDTGLFINMASKAYIGLEDGNVLTLFKRK